MAKPNIRVGQQIMDILTSGMYDQPLMVYREYMQNAADAIDAAVTSGVLARPRARIDITLDGRGRKICIADNGIGLSPRAAFAKLCAIGVSDKAQNMNRGFRGIGRLGGLAYCKTLRFETKSADSSKVATVEWDAERLRSLLASPDKHHTLEDTVSSCVTATQKRANGKGPASFFRMTMEGVSSFYRDDLMDVNAVRRYLSQVAPVSFDSQEFSFAEDVANFLSEVPGYNSYAVEVNGCPVCRPHEDVIEVSANRADTIQGVERFPVHGADGGEIGRGWFAKTNCFASIPPRMAMRGIRVLQGNIQVGDESFLIDCFSEPRFVCWHIGEIHLSYAVKANARRDDFEQTPHYEAFLEQASRLGAHLSHICRSSSKARSLKLQLQHGVEQLAALGEAAFAIDEKHRDEMRSLYMALAGRIEGNGQGTGELPRFRVRLLRELLDGRRLRQLDKKDLLVVLAKRILDEWGGDVDTGTKLEAVLEPFLKSNGATSS